VFRPLLLLWPVAMRRGALRGLRRRLPQLAGTLGLTALPAANRR
jgi:hypothetical protein